MADLTEFVNAFGVEALNETREVHVGDVQQQLRTIQHRRLSSSPFLKLFTTKLPSTVFGRSTASCRRCCAAIFTGRASFQRPTKIPDTILPFLVTPFARLNNFASPKTISNSSVNHCFALVSDIANNFFPSSLFFQIQEFH